MEINKIDIGLIMRKFLELIQNKALMHIFD